MRFAIVKKSREFRRIIQKGSACFNLFLFPDLLSELACDRVPESVLLIANRGHQAADTES